MTHQKTKSIIQNLRLKKHDEGGWFNQTFQSKNNIVCKDRDGQTRPAMTVIHYLVEQEAPRCRLHKNKSDIAHFHHDGGLLRYWTLDEDGLQSHLLGPGHHTQLFVRGGLWKATELIEGDWALISEAVSPGFDYRDRDLADPQDIRAAYPQFAKALAPFLSDH